MDKQKAGGSGRQSRAEGRAPKRVTLEPRLREGSSERAWSLEEEQPKEQGSRLSPAVPRTSAQRGLAEQGAGAGGGQLAGRPADCCGADPSLRVHPCVGFRPWAGFQESSREDPG